MPIIAKQLYTIHGMLMGLAVVLLLTGVYYALAKPQGWYNKHRALQLTATALVAIAVGVSLYTRSYIDQIKNASGVKHGIAGVALLVVLILNVAWGIIGNPNVSRETFFKVHRLLGTVIVVLIVYQFNTGYKVLQTKSVASSATSK